MVNSSTREHIIEAADMLFYQRGYDHTSFADIADKVKISRGNFYYYFKTKDDILEAVIQQRAAQTRSLLETWEEEAGGAEDCIRSFIQILMVNGPKIKRYGCPVGTLNTELAKLNHSSKQQAKAIFSLFQRWLKKQFEKMGHETEAEYLAMHLLARSQGVATMAIAYQDDKFVKREVAEMEAWLAQLAQPDGWAA